MYDGLCGASILSEGFLSVEVWTGHLEVAAQKRISPEPRSWCVTRG